MDVLQGAKETLDALRWSSASLQSSYAEDTGTLVEINYLVKKLLSVYHLLMNPLAIASRKELVI